MAESALRVAIVYDCLFPLATGGGERVYRRMAELLVARGAEVDYLTRRQWQDDAAPEASFSVVPLWRGEIYDAEGNRTTSGALAFARSVFRALRRQRYDIVIASALPVLTLIAARLALVGTRTYLVGDWLEVWTWAKWRSYSGAVTGTAAFILQSLGARAADLDTVNSTFTARRLLAYGRRRSPLVLGLLDLVDLDRPVEASASPPYLLFVGRLIPDKRATAIPAALAVARRRIPDLRAAIVGVGPERQRLQEEIDRLELGAGCELLGRVSDEELESLLSRAAVLVNPSAREGFGLVIAEAAAVGTPSVVVEGEDNAAIDLVAEGVNGTVAASADAEELGSAILSMVEAGAPLRRSTKEWFDSERAQRGLAASVDELLRRYASAR